MGPDTMIFVFWMLSFKPTFSLSSFTFIKSLFSSSSLSAIRVVSSWRNQLHQIDISDPQFLFSFHKYLFSEHFFTINISEKNYLLLSSCLSHIESISLTFITTMLMKVISAFCREWKLGNLVVKCISFDPKVCALIPLSHYAKLNKRNKQKNIPAHDCGDEVSFPRKHSHLL